MQNDLERLLHAYLDGALSPARRAAVEKRLAEPRLAKRLAELQRLRRALAQVEPQPSRQQSQRMWAAIRAQVQPASAKASAWEPWHAFFTRPWTQSWGLGLAGAAAVAVFFVLRTPPAPAPFAPEAAPVPAEAPRLAQAPPAPARKEEVSAKASRAAGSEAASMDRAVASGAGAAAPAAAEGLAKAAPAPVRREATAVERALAEDPVDALIEQFLAQRQGSPLGGAGLAAMSAPRARGLASGASPVAFNGDAGLAAADLATAGLAQGGMDRDGFWNWRPAALALNQRDWNQARIELEAAQSGAGEAVERAFAGSALTLLAAPGAPLQGTQPVLPASGQLRVLGAGRWQLQLDRRLAQFSQGYSVRLPGFRAEGESLVFDLTYDRASFSAGSRFTRLSGEAAARVFDAAERPVEDASFTAPAGADYNVKDQELRLR